MLGCRTTTRRTHDSKIKFVQVKNSIKSLCFVMNCTNLIQLEKKKCEALFSKLVRI